MMAYNAVTCTHSVDHPTLWCFTIRFLVMLWLLMVDCYDIVLAIMALL
jgi:hypothetical protein